MIGIAFLIAAAAVVLASQWVTKQAAMATKQVAVAAVDIEIGSRLTRDMVRAAPWPAGSVPQGAVEDGSQLVERVARTGKPVVLVMITGSAMDLRRAASLCPSIVQAFYPGSLGGRAVAQLLFGAYSPSGRLPVTFYQSTEGLPEFTDYSMKGRTYRYIETEPLYPFGFGLSYTSFAYSDLTLSESALQTGKCLTASVKVTNTGNTDANEVAELYVRAENVPGAPHFQLKGFTNVFIKKGETVTVSFELAPQSFALVNDEGQLVENPGSYTVFIGGSQPDARSAQLMNVKPLEVKIDITGSPAVLEN
jgi:beta-glucosidase